MTTWKEYKLGEICKKIGSGATPRGGSDTYLDIGEYALIRSQNVLDFMFSYNGLAYISNEQAQKLNNVTLEQNDILLNITGDSVARVCQVPNHLLPARVNQHVAIIRPNESKIQNDFLKYYLLNPVFKEYMLMLSSSGATRNAITKGMIENFPISIPPLPTQTAIAEILSSLDDKIELNNKINAELEDLAQTLFKQWFIDFEFPNDQAEPYKSSGGEMIESELGMIPKGWEVKPVGDLFDFVVGGDWGKDEQDDEHTDMNYVIRGTDIPTLKNGSKDLIPYRALKPSKLTNRQLQINDIIIEISGGSKGQPTGRTILVTKEILERLDYKAIPASFCRLIRPKSDFAEIMGIYLTKIYNDGKTWEYQNQSTGISNFQFKFFESSELLALPVDLRILDEFNSLISGFYNLITTNENQELTNLRDTLLPKLISGELEVSEAMAEKV